MIDPKELRIGNWIKYNSDISLKSELINTEVKVTADVIKWASNPSENCYEPIPLTPEILERCGFVVNTELGLTSDRKKRIVYEFDGLYISFEDNSSFIWNEMEDSFLSSAYPEIKYLHTLQNKFYFDKLTGEELVIKELQHA